MRACAFYTGALYIKLHQLLKLAEHTPGLAENYTRAAADALRVPSAVVRSLIEGTLPGYVAERRSFTEDPEALRSHWLDVVQTIVALEKELQATRG